MKEELYGRLCDAMAEFGFERVIAADSDVFFSGDKYVRIDCGEYYATVELANSLHEAENNLYEDIGLYEYSYMREHGFQEDDDIFDEIRRDIVEYIINQ